MKLIKYISMGIACSIGCILFIKLFSMEKRALPEPTYFENALIDAVEHQELDRILNLIGQGAQINFMDEDGATLLHRAVQQNNPELIRLLLDHGIRVNAKDCEGDTALKMATEQGSSEIVELLLLAHAQPLIENNNLKNAIDSAVEEMGAALESYAASKNTTFIIRANTFYGILRHLLGTPDAQRAFKNDELIILEILQNRRDSAIIKHASESLIKSYESVYHYIKKSSSKKSSKD